MTRIHFIPSKRVLSFFFFNMLMNWRQFIESKISCIFSHCEILLSEWAMSESLQLRNLFQNPKYAAFYLAVWWASHFRFSWYVFNRTSVEQSKYFRQRNVFPWFEYKSYWRSYQWLWQTRWTRIPYSQFSLVMFIDPNRTVCTFRSWLDSLGVVLPFWISIPKIFKSLQNNWHRVTYITSFE